MSLCSSQIEAGILLEVYDFLLKAFWPENVEVPLYSEILAAPLNEVKLMNVAEVFERYLAPQKSAVPSFRCS